MVLIFQTEYTYKHTCAVTYITINVMQTQKIYFMV